MTSPTQESISVLAMIGGELDGASVSPLLNSPTAIPTEARGQCNVTALVFCDRFGGEILKTPVGNDWHFYNRVAGTVYALTAEQFSVLPAYLDIPSNRDEALESRAPKCYQALAARVSEALASK